MDPLGEPSTAESSFSWVLFLTIRCLTRREAPKAPAHGPGKAPTSQGPSWIPGSPTSETGPPRSLSPQYQWPGYPRSGFRGQPYILKGRAGVPRPRGPSYESRKQKAQPIEYRDHRDHRSLGPVESLQRSPINSSFGEHKCTLMKTQQHCETTRPSAAWRASRARSSDERRR